MKQQMKTKSAFLLLCLMLFSGAAIAQDASATAALQQKSIQVGDPVQVAVKVSHRPDFSQITWFPLPDSFGRLEVLGASKIDTLQERGQTVYTQQIEVTGFDSGRFVIPSFQFKVQPVRGAAYTLITDSLSLLVQTLPVDTTQPFRPIKDVMKVPVSWRDYIWYGVGVLVVLLLAFLLFYYLKHRTKAAALPPPPENLSDKTLRMLRALEQKKIWRNGEEGVKEYYVALTGILRSYIEARFGVKAMEQTTDEFLQTAKNHPELKAWSVQLFTILHTADMAKFARALPNETMHEQAMQAAQQLVQQSRPVIVDASLSKPK